MTRDLRVQHLPARLQAAADIPTDFVPRPLGPRAEMLAALQRVAPNLDDSDPGCLRFAGPDGEIEILIGPEDPCTSLMLRVGDGKSVPFVVNDILTELGQRALDAAAPSGLFELSLDDTEGLMSWHEFRAAACQR